MTRTVIIALLLLVACASPAQLNKMNAWIATHVTIEHVDVSGRSCGQYLGSHVIQLDPACGDVPWYLWHEVGHALDAQVFNHLFGDTTVTNEQLAQCVAEVVLGYSPHYAPADVAAGYWDCPNPQVAQVRGAMEAAGVW